MRLTQLSEAFIRSAAYERRFLHKNPWDLTMVVWIPLLTVLLIWWIFSQTQITNLPIGVIDQDNGRPTPDLMHSRFSCSHPATALN